MNEKYNELPNLDPTIELDGTEYNLTAVDALWADIARRVEKSLDITLSKHADPKNNTKIIYDGDNPKELSVVPSDGGIFTGSIEIPDHDITTNKKLAVNGNSIENLISEIKGLPTYFWDGEKLDELDSTDDSLSPFRVVIYESDDNNPTGLRFKASDGVSFIECYFLAINLFNGYLSLGHCFSEADTSTSYISLGVARSKYTSIIADLNADGTVKEATGTENTNKSYKRQYDYKDIRNLGQVVYGYYKSEYTSDRYGNGLNDIVRALMDILYGTGEGNKLPNILNPEDTSRTQDYAPGADDLEIADNLEKNGLVKVVADLTNTGNSHISNKYIHRQIFYGSVDVGSYTFPANNSPVVGDIYIKHA